MKKILLSLLVACLGCAVSSNAQVILSQNFTGTTTPGMPTGWTTSLTVVTGTPALGWQTTTAATNLYFGTVSNAAPHTEYAVCNEYADTGNNPAGMISPTFSLVGVTAPYLNFDYVFFEAAYTTPPIVEKLWVDITTDGGTTWHNLDTLHAASVWSIKFESLIPYIGSANCKIRFMYSDLGRSFIGAAIGNIRIFNAPPTEIGLIATTPVAGSTTDYFAVGTGATLGGTIHNGGADTLTSFSASYQVGTDTVVTNMFTGLHIAPMANYDFHCTPYMVTALGTKPVSMWVTKAGDSLLSNDSMNTALIGVSFMPAKKIAVEEATGTWCGWCVRGIVFMDSLAKLYGNDISLIAVHNGDPMTVPAYDTWMGGRISGYPSVVVDRKFVDDPSNLLTIHDQHQNDFGFASITMMPTISGGDVTIPVTINPAINLTGGYKLVLVLTEDGVHSYSTVASTWDQHDYYSGGGYGAMNIDGWAGYNFATLPSVINGSVMYYNHVNRAIVPSPTGVSGYFPSGMVAGGSYTHTFTTPLMAGTPPTGWQISKMHAIVMLIDSATGNVLNSQNADLSLSHVCVGDSLTIMDSVSGGTFTSNATAIATVNSTTGVVMALSAGTVIITHTVGTAHYYTTIIVNPLPAPITGSSLACEYGVTVLSDMGIGTWSISDSSVASISASGVVTGFALGGTAIVTYTNTCGYTTKSITVGTAPYAGTISGASVICSGSLDTLMETMAGGTWTSSDTATMLTPISMGVVVNTSGGTTVTYTVTNACGMASVSQIINVNAMPVAGMVSGTSTLCQGASTTLMDSTMGGMWWSSDSAIASVNPSTGVVWGMGAGTTVIWYTVTNACGSASAGDTVMVNPLPMAGTIMGGTISLCNGDSTTFTSTVSGGMWHSMDTAKATIGATSGIVRSLGLGNDTLVYTVTNTCGTATDTTIVNITHTATAGTITGSSHVCVGSSITLADAVTGGTWRSYKPIIATVDATTGVVTGASYGIDTIWYRIAASCGVDSVSHVVVVDSVLPMVAAISGSSSFCQGQTKVYSDLVAGGVWSSMDTTIATINSVTGAATGVAGGTVVLEYTLSNTCSSFTATDTIVINPLPMVSAITGGTSSLCLGDSTIYMDTTHGGTWDIAIGNATISDMGHVTGVTLGIDTIRYTVSNTCGNTTVWSAINITSTATAGAITSFPFVVS